MSMPHHTQELALEDEDPDPVFEFFMSDTDVLNELEEDPIQMDTSIANVIVLDGLPVVDEKKFPKLVQLINKKCPGNSEIYMPRHPDTKKTMGYAFIEFKDVDSAHKARQANDNARLDKKHVLRANMYDDLAVFQDVPDQFETKAEENYGTTDNLQSFLLDETSRSQYVVRYQDETEIFWNESLKTNENGRELLTAGEEHKRAGKKWTELITAWSPRGSYLATLHRPGIALWGGPDFGKIARFAHDGPKKFVHFSPKENYLVTCNASSDNRCIIVWDIATRKELRSFDGGLYHTWPNFLWSHDDRYIARLGKSKDGKEIISVYQVPEMGLLDKKSIKVPGVKEIQWSPSQNIISYWVPEKDNTPAKVSLIEIPSRKLVREQHSYNITDIKMHWQDRGEYLAVKMTRQKTKKTFTTNFEIFRLNAKNIPIEVMAMGDNVEIVAFAWEPNGPRFAVIHNDGQTHASFYMVTRKKLKKLGQIDDITCNSVHWSPLGGYCLLASMGGAQGSLSLVDAESKTLDVVAEREHFMCNEIEWDPTGRFVLTAVVQPLMGQRDYRYSMENGYKIWTVDGKNKGLFVETTSVSVEQCYQVAWRPAPKPLVDDAKAKEIEAKLKEKYWRQFELEDEKLQRSQLGAFAQKKFQLKEEWQKYRAETLRIHKEEAAERRALRAGGAASDDEEDDFVEVLTEVEEEISRVQTVLD